jgi:hypothetical protein
LYRYTAVCEAVLARVVKLAVDACMRQLTAIRPVGQCKVKIKFTRSLKAPGFNLEPIK